MSFECLSQLSPSKVRISLLAFQRVFPSVLRAHASLLLPALKDVARLLQPQTHGLGSLSAFSSSHLLTNPAVGGAGAGASVGGPSCGGGRASKRQLESLKSANSISLQEVVDGVSCLLSGEDSCEAEALFLRRFIGRIAGAVQIQQLPDPELERVRRVLEDVAQSALRPPRE